MGTDVTEGRGKLEELDRSFDSEVHDFQEEIEDWFQFRCFALKVLPRFGNDIRADCELNLAADGHRLFEANEQPFFSLFENYSIPFLEVVVPAKFDSQSNLTVFLNCIDLFCHSYISPAK
jgi:hypothetical protein